MEPNEALGKWCRDKMMDIKGICIGVMDHLYGCREYILRDPQKGSDFSRHRVQENCLEILEEKTAGEVTVNSYYAPTLLVKEAIDKVTKRKGICVSRIFPFTSSPQYVLENVPKDEEKEPAMYCVDEGRLTVVEDSPNAIKPEDVKGKHPGGFPLISTNTRFISL